jgi:hypothetical protein
MVSTLTMIVPEDIPIEHAKTLVMYWHEKHYSAMKMYTKLLRHAGAACPPSSKITNWIRAITQGEGIQGHASGGGRLPDDRVDTLVISALEECPFHPVRSLASTIKISPTTVWRHLHARGYVVRNLRILPHMLSLVPKAAQVESAIELKKRLCSAKHYGWRYIITGDESWFYFTVNPDRVRVPEGAVAPTRSRQTISSPKQMLTVFWSPLGFPQSKFIQKHIVFILNISVIISFAKLIESVLPPPIGTFKWNETC